jgi:hypothetical protein
VESNGERSAGLSDVRCYSRGRSVSIFRTFDICRGGCDGVQEFINGVVGGVGYFDCGVLE